VLQSAVPGGICRQCTDKPSTAAVQTISAGKKTEQMVWVPTHGGKKYHSKSTCSNMKDPEKVTLSKAKAEGFTACKKCY
jgi:protein-arginine kinase activator protein McsA